jgi:hypothetical protein
MRAVVAADPRAKVIMTHSPADAAPGTPTPQVAHWGPKPDAYELSIPFFSGFLAEARGPGQLIDGGQLYWHRTADDFRVSCDWPTSGLVDEPRSVAMIPEGDDWLVPGGMPADWRGAVVGAVRDVAGR